MIKHPSQESRSFISLVVVSHRFLDENHVLTTSFSVTTSITVRVSVSPRERLISNFVDVSYMYKIAQTCSFTNVDVCYYGSFNIIVLSTCIRTRSGGRYAVRYVTPRTPSKAVILSLGCALWRMAPASRSEWRR